MALDLLTSQKASITVGLDDGSGNVTPLGPNYHFAFTTGNARLAVGPTATFVEAVAEGTDSLHITTMDGSVAIDVPITVTLDASTPVAFLVVTFGTPEPK